MAAPPNKTLKDLNGKWLMNKTLSDSPDPALALQGISWFLRKGIGMATVTLHVKSYTGPPKPPSTSTEQVVHIDIQQTASGGIKGTSEDRCLDGMEREHTDWLFGTVRARSVWAKLEDIPEGHLRSNWIESDAEKSGPNGETHILNSVESIGNGWTASQVWGFQMIGDERRYARNVVVKKGDETVEVRLIYDWLGEEEETQ